MKRIVVIEDNEDIAASLIKRLKAESYETDWISNGWAALSQLLKRENAPDAVILDLMLPGRTGQELLNSIRSVWPFTKIWIFSAYPQYAILIPKDLIQGFFLKNAGIENLIKELKQSI